MGRLSVPAPGVGRLSGRYVLPRKTLRSRSRAGVCCRIRLGVQIGPSRLNPSKKNVPYVSGVLGRFLGSAHIRMDFLELPLPRGADVLRAGRAFYSEEGTSLA
jgi:hypothetical protein